MTLVVIAAAMITMPFDTLVASRAAAEIHGFEITRDAESLRDYFNTLPVDLIT